MIRCDYSPSRAESDLWDELTDWVTIGSTETGLHYVKTLSPIHESTGFLP